MTSYSEAGGPAGQFGRKEWRGCGSLGRWRPLEIAAVVIGFAVWWPIGLALLGLRIAQRRGYSMNDAMGAMRAAFDRGRAGAGAPQWRPFNTPGTGNAAFDEWRAAEMHKLEEERRRLDAAQRDFAEHLANLRRARDRDEFDGFMRARDQNRPAA